jgi:hypothetical protein
MKLYMLGLILLVWVILSVFVGFAAWSASGNRPVFLLETYKLLLGFTLVGVIGVVVKAVVDARIDSEKESRKRYEEKQKELDRRYEEWERIRGEIVKEFTNIFSEFYSVRKLYHSAISDNNIIYDKSSKEFKILLQDCLRKTTELEGRYGALKILIIRHFGLPSGNFGFKSVSMLVEKKKTSSNERQRLRYALDILGEAYDDWRHALEKSRKIDVSESWNAYEEIFGFLDEEIWKATSSNPAGGKVPQVESAPPPTGPA